MWFSMSHSKQNRVLFFCINIEYFIGYHFIYPYIYMMLMCLFIGYSYREYSDQPSSER